MLTRESHGTMTRAMRAVRPVHQENARATLRVAVIKSGVIAFERLFESGHVHIGTDPECDVIVEDGPARHRLFEHHRGGYRLKPWAGLQLKVSSQTPELEMNARGALSVGKDTRILFHVLPAAPVRARPALPHALERGVLGQIDWFTTVVAAFSFLLHFFAVALVYSDWLDPIVDDHAVITTLVETSKRVHAPPPLTTPETAPETTASPRTGASSTPTAAKATKGTKNQGTGRAGVFQNKKGGESANDRAAALGAELDALGFQTLGALGDGQAIGVVMEDGNVPIADLDAAGRSRKGADAATDLKMTDGSQSDDFEPGGNGDGHRGPTQKRRSGPDAETAGKIKKTKGPRFTGSTSGNNVTAGNIPGASGVIARMRAPFRNCYRTGLDANPTLQGATNIVATVAANGSVTSVSGGGGALAPISGCLKAIVRGAQFAPPKNGRGVVSISVNFLLAK